MNGSLNTESLLSLRIEKEEFDPKLAYDVDERPPWFVTVTTAFQHTILCVGSVLAIVTILSDVVCADLNDPVRSILFSSSILVIGLSTENNMTNLTAKNMSHSLTTNIVYSRLTELQGSLIAASLFEVVIGLTGLIGLLMRFISPITIGIGSRIVMVVSGIIAVILAIIGQFGAVMTSVPAPVLGGITLAVLGVLCTLGISALQTLNSDPAETFL
ncbi:SLC23A1 [Mytilus coruscus]|uniref:SLC23A1 n=1 Tax=Mytilus coruscus TaxID=42192 RepID=A0A6J8EYD0_MYTCO|nr:SLC23A1 [Mytilus coruscus]